MQEKLFLIGIGLIFIGILVTIISAFIQGKGKVEYGFGGFIGPIPFGFGSNERMVYIVIALSLIVLLIFFLLNKKIF